MGRSMELRVEYPWRPPVCSHCRVYRQRFSSGEGSSRGGFAGRGRGGFGGRGFGDQRLYRNENVQFVPVNKGKESVNVGGAER
ncbi:hypothetical protein Tco_0584654, partial [Tanacetum coccineum]